jgi:hypothetical protein
MRPDQIRDHLRKVPFRAIRIFISDGSSYDVRHPEMMLITRTEVAIALDPGDGEMPDRSVYCDPVHVTRIEPLSGNNRKAGRPKRK